MKNNYDTTHLSRWIKATGLFFVLCSLFVSPAGAQVRFGLKGGFQLAKMDFNGETLKSSNRVGFFAGPTLKIGLPLSGLAVDASLLYDQHDLKVEDETFTQQSLLFVGDMRAGAGLGDVLNIFLLAGPQFSFNIGDDIRHWKSTINELKQFSLQETMLSINLGVGVTFARHLEGTLRYNIPISKTADFTWSEISDHLTDQTWHHAKSRTNAWSVAVAYYF